MFLKQTSLLICLLCFLSAYSTSKHDSLKLHLKSINPDSVESKADVLISIGMEYLLLSKYDNALEYSLQALRIYESLENKSKQAYTLNIIGAIYKSSKQYELALTYFEKTLKLLREQNREPKAIGKMLSNIGAIHSAMNKQKLALNNYLEAERNFNNIQNFNTSKLSNNIGWSYYLLKNYKKSIIYYKKAISESIKHGDTINLPGRLNNIGMSFMELNILDSAEYYITQSNKLHLSSGNPEPKKLLENLKSNAQLWAKKGDFEQSNKFLQKYLTLNDSIYSIEQSKALNELQIKYETENKEQEIKLLESRDRLKTQQTQILILIIILVLIITIMIYLQKRRIKDRLKINQLKQEQLSNELTVTNRLLTNFALLSVEKNEFSVQLYEHIKELKKKDFIKSEPRFKEMIKLVTGYQMSNKNRQLFDDRMEEVCERFFIVLSNNYPNLTQTEKKLAALLRLNLSSKEIANLMNVTSKSVDNYRYNLRTKLNLSSNINLNTFFTNI